ncbi:MFS transporter [Gracilimonas mengyeensis]|uniref:Predicted arabinose efflux permease, MFS family n=1 Tax=Gracilimonas mengyeensis TaxID=1302730 RepID=A0A521EY18_9BACT|nr:MFS transporter [Gracilimonas mengyeensis]SMO88838.1 Predicted arabinose efflux permease, MFS family [Gracilimonas mengyeensis]
MIENLRPYLQLIKENHDFRRLWLAQSISNFGDWFGLLALYAIIGRYSDSEFLLGLIIVVKMLSLAAFSPIAGYFADRFNRRRLMIWCDILRGLAVLGIILVQSPEMLWLAYVLTAVQMMLSAVFEPAKTSSIPNVTSEEDLTNANIISTATWSIIFTTGMAIGGFATEWLGTDRVLILDTLTYLLSAWFVYRAAIPQKSLSDAELKRTRNPFKGISEGLRYLLSNRHILRPSLAKGTSTMFLGGLVYLLIIVSEEVLMMGSIGLGLLYAARGFGTGIGPIIGRRIFRDEKDWVKMMGLSILFCGVMYMVVGFVNSITLMLIFVLLAHSASGANWVSSTVLLQKRTQDTFRGRIFSTEWLLFTIGNSISVVIASLVLESGWLTVKPLIMIYGGIMVLAGIIWSFTITRNERDWQGQEIQN